MDGSDCRQCPHWRGVLIFRVSFIERFHCNGLLCSLPHMFYIFVWIEGMSRDRLTMLATGTHSFLLSVFVGFPVRLCVCTCVAGSNLKHILWAPPQRVTALQSHRGLSPWVMLPMATVI